MISPASTELPSRDHLRTFYILTITQVLSLIGSAMSHVASGMAILVMTAAVYALPKTRSLEADLPDYAAR